jgi:hypothetical protein
LLLDGFDFVGGGGVAGGGVCLSGEMLYASKYFNVNVLRFLPTRSLTARI